MIYGFLNKAVITSPPYWGLRDYKLPDVKFPDGWVGQLGHEPSFHNFIRHLIEIFDEIKRVLKPTGTCFVNISDTYAGSQSTNSSIKTANQIKAHLTEAYRKETINKNVEGIPNKSLCMIPYRFAQMMIDSDEDDIYELRKDLTSSERLSIIEEINKYKRWDNEKNKMQNL